MFNGFYRKMLSLYYFKFMKERGKLIKDDIWYNLCKNFTPAGVFEALVRHDAKVEYDTIKIWGDKSPSYINHAGYLLKKFFHTRVLFI